jgi:hypothetical protein
MAMRDPGARRRFEMGITRAEFLRLLPIAVGAFTASRAGDSFAGETEGVTWSLSITERPRRRIAGLTLPVLDVELRCAAVDAARVERFTARFLLAFQRAGG